MGFIAYLLPLPLKLINDLTYSTTVKHLSSDAVRKVRLGVPPETEQRAIAAFLDRETARIDDLIAKKEKLIDLLQEQRTALITRAVTKGLDPNAPTKDSGIEWLGRFRRIGRLKGRNSPPGFARGTRPAGNIRNTGRTARSRGSDWPMFGKSVMVERSMCPRPLKR